MKAYLYKVKVYESLMDWSHGIYQVQERLYIPGMGVLGFRSIDKIDFFSEDREILDEAERVIKGDVGEGELIREVEVSEGLVDEIILLSRKLKQIREEFKEKASALIKSIGS